MSLVLITDRIQYYVSVYAGYGIVLFGVIGNTINILLFTQLKLFRKNQSAFYLTVAAIIDSCQLFLTAFVHATAAAFDFDPTRTSLVWCKYRIYLVQLGSVSSATIVCFTAIDQYLSTSHYAQLRQLSNFKSARHLVFGLLVVAALFCIPTPIFQEIRRSNCAIYNSSYNYYYSFVYFCIIIGLLPVTIASSFSLLSYQNVRRIVRRQIPIVRRRLDRQLTAMILSRVVLFVVTTLPFVIFRTYQVNRSLDQTDAYAVSVDQLFRTVTTVFYNSNSAVKFTRCSSPFQYTLQFLGRFLCISDHLKPISSTSGILVLEKNLAKIDVIERQE